MSSDDRWEHAEAAERAQDERAALIDELAKEKASRVTAARMLATVGAEKTALEKLLRAGDKALEEAGIDNDGSDIAVRVAKLAKERNEANRDALSAHAQRQLAERAASRGNLADLETALVLGKWIQASELDDRPLAERILSAVANERAFGDKAVRQVKDQEGANRILSDRVRELARAAAQLKGALSDALQHAEAGKADGYPIAYGWLSMAVKMAIGDSLAPVQKAAGDAETLTREEAAKALSALGISGDDVAYYLENASRLVSGKKGKLISTPGLTILRAYVRHLDKPIAAVLAQAEAAQCGNCLDPVAECVCDAGRRERGDCATGLYCKFQVRRTDGSSSPGGKHERCEYFVLDWQHDTFTVPAILAYAAACEARYPDLASDPRNKARAHGAVADAAKPARPKVGMPVLEPGGLYVYDDRGGVVANAFETPDGGCGWWAARPFQKGSDHGAVSLSTMAEASAAMMASLRTWADVVEVAK
jgi:hypothetical protein